MELKHLLDSASKDLKSLIELKNLAIKLGQYELGSECRRLEKELYPVSDEESKAKERVSELKTLFSMVKIGFQDDRTYFIIDKTLELYKKKKGKFDLKDSAKILSDANKLFER